MTIIFFIVFANYFILILLLGWYWHKPSILTKNTNFAKADVIVACRNEAPNITSLLMALLAQKTKEIELYVVDDHSTDNTMELASTILQENGCVISSTGEGKKAALKTGAVQASNPWLIMLDADVELPENWLQNAMAVLHSTDADVVLFPISLYSKNPLAALEELDFISLMVTTAATANMGQPTMANGAAMAVKRELWLDASAELNPQIASGDDVFLVHAAKRKKKKVVWAHDASLIVKTKGTCDAKALLHQRIRWGKKATKYSDVFTNYLSWSVFLFSMAYVAMGITAVFTLNFLPFLALFAVKLVVDLFVLTPAAAWLGNKKRRVDILWVSPLHPFFILTIALLGFVVRPTWKDRRI